VPPEFVTVTTFPKASMGILQKLFPPETREPAMHYSSSPGRRGALVHIFVFDSGPRAKDESKYASTVARSLLPEAMAYPDVPVTFSQDDSMPPSIGRGKFHDIELVTHYSFAWQTIRRVNPILVEGLKVGDERYTFSWEEYSSESGNRGILFAFYGLME
jgi:hypothetical protein